MALEIAFALLWDCFYVLDSNVNHEVSESNRAFGLRGLCHALPRQIAGRWQSAPFVLFAESQIQSQICVVACDVEAVHRPESWALQLTMRKTNWSIVGWCVGYLL